MFIYTKNFAKKIHNVRDIIYGPYYFWKEEMTMYWIFKWSYFLRCMFFILACNIFFSYLFSLLKGKVKEQTCWIDVFVMTKSWILSRKIIITYHFLLMIIDFFFRATGMSCFMFCLISQCNVILMFTVFLLFTLKIIKAKNK